VALLTIPGVESVGVDFSTRTATVRMKAGESIDRPSVEAALGTVGYSVNSFAEQATGGEAKPAAP
jgi:hypothetical protein